MRIMVRKKPVSVSVVDSCYISLLSTHSTFWHQQSKVCLDTAFPSLL